MLTRLLLLISSVACGITMAAVSTQAAGPCSGGTAPVTGPGGGLICVTVKDPGTPARSGKESGPATSTASSNACHRRDGSTVDCVTLWGVWDSGHQCWIHPVDVPRSDPVWKGHSGGATWMCALVTDSDPTVVFWLPPGGSTVALPDPGQLARRALGVLRLETARVHTAPLYPAPTFVGVENWLWVPAAQWVELSKTVTAGRTAVTVTAKPDRVVWQTGAGSKVCHDAGRVWSPGMTDAAKTACGYTYRVTSDAEPGGVFVVSAVIGYRVNWVCRGACTSGAGSLGLVDAPAGTGRLRVLQRQTVVVTS